MQKLVQPINNMKVTASKDNQAYANKFGFWHYGSDLTSIYGATNRTVYASGNGTVAAAGWDYNAGYTVIVNYPQAYNHNTGKYQDVVARYFHLNSIASGIKKGAKVTKDTVLGVYGGSGSGKMNKWDPHLHLEMDTDTKYPEYSPTFKGSTAIIKGTSSGATAATMVNPLDYLHTKPSKPDNQTYTTTNDAYINSNDRTLPTV